MIWAEAFYHNRNKTRTDGNPAEGTLTKVSQGALCCNCHLAGTSFITPAQEWGLHSILFQLLLITNPHWQLAPER